MYGSQTGAAMPLMWAHAEYIKLLRSASDGRIFDLIDEVRDRYMKPGRKPSRLMRLETPTAASIRLRPAIACASRPIEPFMLHWTNDEWQHVNDTASISTPLGFEYVDIDVAADATRADPLHLQLARNPTNGKAATTPWRSQSETA